MSSKRASQYNIIFVLLFLVLTSWPAFALEISEDFSTTTRRDSSSTLVWNTVLGLLHPPLQVSQYLDGSLQDRNFSIGTGADGAFTPGRYSEFSVGGNVTGNIIRLDTDVVSNRLLEFTTFNLASGWTLQPQGSYPLIIRVLGMVTIAGTINCSGDDGGDHNSDPTVVINGGTGRCGGGNGGAGSTTTLAATAGLNGGPQTGGFPSGGGPALAVDLGGGGGGTYAISRGVGFDPTDGSGGAGGDAGFILADNDFDIEGGGFGGGGGGHHAGSGAGFDSAGAGGGAGGGYIFITAGGMISITGEVLANGGNGGTGTTSAGGGGGGGGGSIALFSGADVYIDPTSSVSADRGLGGASGGRVGGNGSVGRTWLVGESGASTGAGPWEFPDASVTTVGVVRFQTGIFSATSNEIDSGNTQPTLTSVNTVRTLPGGSTITVRVESDAQSGFTPVWGGAVVVPATLERYVRFQISLNSLSLTTAATVDLAEFELTGTNTNNFDFVSACGSIGGGLKPPTSSLLFLYFTLCLVPLVGYLGLRRLYQA